MARRQTEWGEGHSSVHRRLAEETAARLKRQEVRRRVRNDELLNLGDWGWGELKVFPLSSEELRDQLRGNLATSDLAMSMPPEVSLETRSLMVRSPHPRPFEMIPLPVLLCSSSVLLTAFQVEIEGYFGLTTVDIEVREIISQRVIFGQRDCSVKQQHGEFLLDFPALSSRIPIGPLPLGGSSGELSFGYLGFYFSQGELFENKPIARPFGALLRYHLVK